MSARAHIGAVLICSVLVTAGRPEVVTHEGNVFPENHENPWERVGTFDADRSLIEGWLLVEVDLGDWNPPPGGEQDFYKRRIAEFPGSPPFFVEWRCITDAPNTEIPGGGGITLNATNGAVNNHFRIAEDTVRIWRSNEIPFVFVDIDPGVAHTYRIEHYGAQLYIYYIDAEVVDSGLPEGDFPSESARIIWGGSMWWTPNTNEWDYVRYGRIPDAGRGDSDSDLDIRDFYFFDECLANGRPDTEAGPGCVWADMDQDGDVDFHDFALFQLAFTGQ